VEFSALLQGGELLVPLLTVNSCAPREVECTPAGGSCSAWSECRGRDARGVLHREIRPHQADPRLARVMSALLAPIMHCWGRGSGVMNADIEAAGAWGRAVRIGSDRSVKPLCSRAAGPRGDQRTSRHGATLATTHEERPMSAKLATTEAPRPSLIVLLSLLATVRCNAVLGIHGADCVGECEDAGARWGELSEEEAPPSEAVPASNASGPKESEASANTDFPTSLEGVLPTSDPAATGLVDIITSACAEQAPGEPFCVVNHRVICNEEGSPDIVSVCADAEHCLRGTGPDCAICSEAEGGACSRPVCVPDERRCRGETLEVCDSTGTFVLLEQCSGRTTCSADQGCVGDACAANERRCQGDKLQQCNEARTRFETIQTCGRANRCDGAAGRCIE
jgi:hypothetical protein